VTNDAPRRRRRRRGRRGGERRPRENALVNVKPRQAPWQWGTFPVFFAFAIGALVMGLLVLIAPRAFTVFLIGAVFLSVFGVAHFFGRTLRGYRSNDADET
jgi:VIT1/CCC1 family predicted Fe2+/Mn2+ transporter